MKNNILTRTCIGLFLFSLLLLCFRTHGLYASYRQNAAHRFLQYSTFWPEWQISLSQTVADHVSRIPSSTDKNRQVPLCESLNDGMIVIDSVIKPDII